MAIVKVIEVTLWDLMEQKGYLEGIINSCAQSINLPRNDSSENKSE